MRSAVFMLLALVLLTPRWSIARADLRHYVQQPDDSYAYEVRDAIPNEGGRCYRVRMTSQTWRGHPWRHWLSILVPPEVVHPHRVILVIAGGSNEDGPPEVDSPEAELLTAMAARMRAVVAVVQQVPNQPLLGGLEEDDLIARTFQKFFETGQDDWPLLLPMTQSAVRAMDTVQQVMRRREQRTVRSFIVTGASKRGWTTWLTAAVDPRVEAIAPMVIDILHMPAQIRHQIRTYGQPSDRIHPYTERGLLQRLDTPRGRRLVEMVDPYAFRRTLTMPKLVVLGTNDPYWTVDAANLYFPDLPEPAYLHYEPGAGHGLGPGIVSTLIGFYRHILRDEPMPRLDWHRGPKGALVAEWDDPDAEPTLWTAHSNDRDFRDAEWTSRPVSTRNQRCRVQPEPPEEGWLAYFVQVRFPGPHPLLLSTRMTVTPDRFPHHAP